MTATPASPVALPPENPRFLVLRAATGAIHSSAVFNALNLLRVRVVPDPTGAGASHWPSYDGFALIDRQSRAATRLFVIDPISRALLEWQLKPGAIVPGQAPLTDWRGS